MDANTLRPLVIQALDALEIPYVAESAGILRATVPTGLQQHFINKAELILVFDQDVWQSSREADLVAPGSAVLRGLESALQAIGAGFSRYIGGQITVPDSSLSEWKERITILNGELMASKKHIAHQVIIRLLYEATLPGPPTITELVPIGYDIASDTILTAEQLSEIYKKRLYTPQELQGLLTSPLTAPDKSVLHKARERCQKELIARLGPFVQKDLKDREFTAQEERARLQREYKERIVEIDNEKDANEAEEELKRRLDLVGRMTQAAVDVREQVVELIYVGQSKLELDYTVKGQGQIISYWPKLLKGRVRLDQCSQCGEIRDKYYLWHDGGTQIVCSECGCICGKAECGGVIIKEDVSCHLCASSEACSLHNRPCGECGESTCETHIQKASCCETWLCDQDFKTDASTNASLCGEHIGICSVDGKTYHVDTLIECPVTGKHTFLGNTVTLENDGRSLHPSAVVICATTNVKVARDRAEICAVDNELHSEDVVTKCAITNDFVCTRHQSVCDQPKGLIIKSDRVRVCSKTGLKTDLSFTRVCSVDQGIYLKEETEKCPVTGKRFARHHGITPPSDDRILHPKAIHVCATTNEAVAQDRSSLCRECEQHHYHSDLVLKACEKTQALVCPAHLVCCDVPEGVWVAKSRLRICQDTGKKADVSEVQPCSITKKSVLLARLALCPISNKHFLVELGITLADDARLLHPETIFRCVSTGAKVARDRVVHDEFDGNAPLHPDAAIQCEQSKKWTAKKAVVLTDCCRLQVACSLTGKSKVSQRVWCIEHVGTCVADDEKVLQDELIKCEKTNAPLCKFHRFTAECCQRILNSDYVVQAGASGLGCTDHYVKCQAGKHFVLLESMLSCFGCSNPLCSEHAVTCECHNENQHKEHLEPDPYHPKPLYCRSEIPLYCRSEIMECERCGLPTPKRKTVGGGMNRCWSCDYPKELSESSLLQKIYDDCVAPNRPWYRLKTRVTAMGNEHVAVFIIDNLLGKKETLRIHDAGKEKYKKVMNENNGRTHWIEWG